MMSVHLCVLICVYLCVYIYVSLTHITHVHIFMYICAQNLTHIQTLINSRLFVRLFDYIFVCVPCTASICIRLCIRLRSYFATAIVPELIFLLYTYIFNIRLRMMMLVMTTISTAYTQRSIENEDASDSSYDTIRNHRCDLLHNSLSTIDEPLYII